MCGIVGLVHRDRERPVDSSVVRGMCAAIRHRGPDDDGCFVQGPVGLGMRRLSIIDLAGGHQPIFTENRSKAIVFNGEIYNYRDLRDGLLARGHHLTTHSDTETVVHLYEELGERCVERLRGMFAFAIWDATEHRLLLARDRFGIKPLYFVAAEWGIAFASELKALLAGGFSERSLDWQALDAYFQLGYIPAPATPFRDIRKLEPAHVLIWSEGGGVVTRRYWDLPPASAETPPDLNRNVLEWLDDSVSAHLVSDVPVAAFLSGGLDSSAIVASMALANGTPHAFTVRFRGSAAEQTDESRLAKALADRYGARHTIIDVRPDLTEIVEPIARAMDEPHADESAIPTWLISQAVAQEYKVVLAGTGGDELFAGYRRHLGVLVGDYWRRLPGSVQRGARALASLLPEPRSGGLGVDRLKRFLRAPATTVPDRLLGFVSRLSDEERRVLYTPGLGDEVVGQPGRASFQRAYLEGGEPSGLRGALLLDYRFYLPDDLLALSDRLSMAHSLEVRVPFVDHELVERVFPLLDRTKIGPWRLKHLLKRALRNRLPAEHFRAPKRGFVGPTAVWLRRELRPLVESELAPERMRRLGMFDPRIVGGLLEDHFTQRQNREGILWALLCFVTWHRVYVESAPSVARTAGR
jgi:asparagine synthase (glutamine-hydrolysing)